MSTPVRLKERSIRMTIMDLVEIQTSESSPPVSAHIDNISRTGMFIRTDQPLPVGSKVNLKFVIKADKFSTISTKAEVVRVVRPDINLKDSQETSSPFFESLVPGMGVRFINMDLKNEEMIKQSILSTKNRHEKI